MSANRLQDIESAAQSMWLNEQIEGPGQLDLFNSFDKKGMQVYAKLLRTNWQDVLESIYPLTQKVIGPDWDRAMQRYIKVFPPTHFNLNRLAQNFSAYLSQYESPLPPFICELADYEWLELEVMEHTATVPDLKQPAPSTLDDFMMLSPKVNPTVFVRHYSYDILQIANLLEQEGYDKSVIDQAQLLATSFVVAFRPPGCRYCEFLELSQSEAALLDKAMAVSNSATDRNNSDGNVNLKYSDLAKLAISQCPDAAPEVSSLEFIETIEQFHNTGIFV